MQNGRCQFLGLHPAVTGVAPLPITAPQDLSPGNPGPSEGEAEDVSPVVPPPLGIDLGRPSELANRDDQRFRQQSPLAQVVEQRGKRDVKQGAQHILQPVGVLGVGVPHRVVDRLVPGLAAPVDVNQPRSRLDQPPSQQQRLSPLG